MRKVRLFCWLMLALLMPVTVGAASLSIESFTISAGEEKQMIIDLSNSDMEVTLVQFDLSLPSGLTLKQVDGDYDIDIAGRTTWKKHSLQCNATDGIIRFLLASQNNSVLTGTSGAIVNMTIKADGNFSGGTIKLQNILIVDPNLKESKPSDVTVTIKNNTPSPKLELTASPSGGQISAGTTVTLTAKADGSTVFGCDIYYTTNGTTPSKSNGTKYSSGITINSSCTLKAIANKSGYEDSDVLTATYTITANPQTISINSTNFPDENFRNYLLSQDYGKDGKLTDVEINERILLNLDNKYITNLKGIEFFSALRILRCSHNQLTTLDLSKNTAITQVSCDHNQLTSLDLSKNTAITQVRCDHNQLKTLDLSKNTALYDLDCNNNKLTSLDMSNKLELYHLVCDYNQLTALNLSKSSELNYLSCPNNQLTSLDLSQNTKLSTLNCEENQLEKLVLPNNTSLSYLYCNNNKLTALDVSTSTALHHLNCYNNKLTDLDVSKNTALVWLDCYNNSLTTLDVTSCTALTYLQCSKNNIKGKAMDALINSLPNYTSFDKHYFRAVYEPASETNVCTTTQVAAVRAKGWIPQYFDSGYKEYKGSEETPEPTAIAIVPNEVTLRPGESVKLTVVLTPANAATTLTWIWLPYCSGAYEFDGKGIVTAIAGQYDSDNVIEVRTSNGLSAQAFITVLNSTDVQLPTAYSNGDNPIYSVTGQRRLILKKGLNIVGGKKIVIK